MGVNYLVKAAVACGAVLVLAGCGAGVNAGSGGPKLPLATTDGSPGSTSSTGSSAIKPAVPLNERGFIVKQLGEPACFGGTGANCVGGVSFAIDQVEVDPRCMEYGLPPENGHTLLLHLRIATGSDEEAIDRISGIINPFSFVEIGRDGVTRDTSFGMCADPTKNKLPDTYGPNQQYQGVMDLEATEASGIIALQLMMPDEDGQRGWEWTYPV